MKRKFNSELFSSGGSHGESSLSSRKLQWRRGPLLGRGGFGSVYLATLKNPNSGDQYMPELMAIKSAEYSQSSSLQKEKQILHDLRDCCYVLHCFGEETTTTRNGKTIYNIMLEFASGGTLSDLIKRSGGSGLPEPVVKRYTRNILKGVEYIHSRGYVHCDLKPDNILLVPPAFDGDPFVPVIGDFGLAKRMKNGDSGIGGTSLYMAPETVIDRIQEAPSDIWAVGCIVLEMLTGRKVWDLKPGMTSGEIFDLIRKSCRSSEIPLRVSEEWKWFLKGCLVRDPKLRLTARMLLRNPLVAEESFDEGVLDLPGFKPGDYDEVSCSSFVDDWDLDSVRGVGDGVKMPEFVGPAGKLQAV